MFLKEHECFFVSAPEGEEFDPLFLVLKNFLLEFRNVLRPPVVSGSFQPEPNQHFGPIFGIALTCVERNDASGNEFCPIEIFSFFPQKTRECKSKTKKNTDHGIN